MHSVLKLIVYNPKMQNASTLELMQLRFTYTNIIITSHILISARFTVIPWLTSDPANEFFG